MKEVIHAKGHENVSAAHASTFEITTEDWLTPAGDCILAVEADRALSEFDPEFVSTCQREDAIITVLFEAGDLTEKIVGNGHPDLSFESERSMVGRTSEYIDERTFVVGAEKAAAGFDRQLVAALADGAALRVEIQIE